MASLFAFGTPVWHPFIPQGCILKVESSGHYQTEPFLNIGMTATLMPVSPAAAQPALAKSEGGCWDSSGAGKGSWPTVVY